MGKVKTKERLRESALVLFANHGFANTKVAEICQDAQANIAAINYYFGSKEGLYIEVCKQAFTHTLPQYNTILDTGSTCSKEGLYAHIFYLISHIQDPAFNIFEHELSHSTGLIDTIIEEAFTPYTDKLIEHIVDIATAKVNNLQVNMYCQSILSQCFFYQKTKILSQSHKSTLPHLPLDIQTYTQHVYAFSLAGIEKS